MPRARLPLILVCLCTIGGCSHDPAVTGALSPSASNRIKVTGVAAKIVEGARQQCHKPAKYDASYRSIPYPGGDVAADRGACTDVIIRALRNAGYDLQKLIHEDMKENFSAYPRRGEKTDTNIDHRRVPNQQHFFAKFGRQLSIRTDGAFLKQWQPGDIVTWKLDSGLDHTGVLSDEIDIHGRPFVIHNLQVTAEEDVLTSWKITGHYRFPK